MATMSNNINKALSKPVWWKIKKQQNMFKLKLKRIQQIT